jgi:hypothetical protein
MSGSLRSGSYSNAVLETLREKFSGRAEIVIWDLGIIPLYNQDFEGEKRPEPVKELISAIAESDGLVLCAPEFNHSIPGVLKNALDWASRPAFTSVMAYKPVAIMATSRGARRRAMSRAFARRARLDAVAGRVGARGHHYLFGRQNTRWAAGRRDMSWFRVRRRRGAAARDRGMAESLESEGARCF